MHERSLVQSLLSQVEHLSAQHDAVAVDSVTVELGPLSGVEAELIRSAYSDLAALRFRNEPELIIREVPLRVRCRSCGRQSTVLDLVLQCSGCGSTRVHITSGDAFCLVDIGLQVPTPA